MAGVAVDVKTKAAADSGSAFDFSGGVYRGNSSGGMSSKMIAYIAAAVLVAIVLFKKL